MLNDLVSCKIICTSNVEHLSQLYTGFGLLKDRGLINVEYVRSKEYKVNGKQLLITAIDNRWKIAYDTADDERVYDFALQDCDFYFKRSYSSQHAAISKKIRPLGLNYAVYGGSDGSFRRALWAFGENGTSSIRVKIRGIVDSSQTLSRIASDKYSGRNLLRVEAFEDLPKRERAPLILFLARVWDPSENSKLSPGRADERHAINSMRAACIRGLRKELGRSFIGGFASSRFAETNFPDCIVGPSFTQKSAYLKHVRSAGICVATMGLDRSNGWKLGEYVANAKAIVSEPLCHEVTGDFKDGVNYLVFNSPEECVESAVRLIEDADLRYEMKVNNYSYYHRFLRPDVLVWNTIQCVLFES